ncbi:MAG: hypothetical protein FWE36_08325 [Erysipelotrichales bacterium]|nr:hypothetical protein [Erysipelotrichales bacterium]
MRIRNHRRKKSEFGIFMAFIVFFVIIVILWNFLSAEPEQGFSFWGPIAIIILAPTAFFILHHIIASKDIVIEELGVAEYKKGKLKKLLKYEDVQVINVRKIDIFINGTRKPDYPYAHVNTAFGILFRLLFSSKFRKRFDEDKIIFKNHRKGFKEIELPFIIEIAKRSNCEVILFDNYLTEDNTNIINNALKHYKSSLLNIETSEEEIFPEELEKEIEN